MLYNKTQGTLLQHLNDLTTKHECGNFKTHAIMIDSMILT